VSAAITLEELLKWNDESAKFWKTHLEANSALLELPCGIGGAANVQELIRHVWGAELRWAERIAGLPTTDRELIPTGPVEALFGVHLKAGEIYRSLLDDAKLDWDEKLTFDFPWVPEKKLTGSRRKLMAHGLFHSQRHWAQLATLVRTAGFPSKFFGDILFSSALS
jgi:uncharacterized damage-inducible protein DinB